MAVQKQTNGFLSGLAGVSSFQNQALQRQQAQQNLDLNQQKIDQNTSAQYIAELAVSGVATINSEKGTLTIAPDGLEKLNSLPAGLRESLLNENVAVNNFLDENGVVKKGKIKTFQPMKGNLLPTILKKELAEDPNNPELKAEAEKYRSGEYVVYAAPIETKPGVFSYLTSKRSAEDSEDNELIVLSGSQYAGLIQNRLNKLYATKNPTESTRAAIVAREGLGQPQGVGASNTNYLGEGYGEDGALEGSDNPLDALLNKALEDTNLTGEAQTTTLGLLLGQWEKELNPAIKDSLNKNNKDVATEVKGSTPRQALNSGEVQEDDLVGTRQLAKEGVGDREGPEGFAYATTEELALLDKNSSKAYLTQKDLHQKRVLDLAKAKRDGTLDEVNEKYKAANLQIDAGRKGGAAFESKPRQNLEEQIQVLETSLENRVTEGYAKTGNKELARENKLKEQLSDVELQLENTALTEEDKTQLNSQKEQLQKQLNTDPATGQPRIEGSPIAQVDSIVEGQTDADALVPDLGLIKNKEQALELINSGKLEGLLTSQTIETSRRVLTDLGIQSGEDLKTAVQERKIKDPFSHAIVMASALAGPGDRANLEKFTNQIFDYITTGDATGAIDTMVKTRTSVENSKTSRMAANTSRAQLKFSISQAGAGKKRLDDGRTAFIKGAQESITARLQPVDKKRGKTRPANLAPSYIFSARSKGYIEDYASYGRNSGIFDSAEKRFKTVYPDLEYTNTMFFLEAADKQIVNLYKQELSLEAFQQLKESSFWKDAKDWAGDWVSSSLSANSTQDFTDRMAWRKSDSGLLELTGAKRTASGKYIYEADESIDYQDLMNVLSPDTINSLIMVLPTLGPQGNVINPAVGSS